MENKFYTDDEFEHFLKDATDNFKMYPSKKVWYSIYNDLHPSRKWPSLAVCFLLIFAILYVGVSNNNSINESKKSFAGNKYFAGESSNTAGNKITKDDRTVALLGTGTHNQQPVMQANQGGNGQGISNTTVLNDATAYYTAENGQVTAKIKIVIRQSTAHTDASIAGTNSQTTTVISTQSPISTPEYTAADNTVDGNEIATTNTEAILSTPEKKDADVLNKTNILKNILSKEDKEWIENYAYNQQASVSKFKSRAAVQYYVTPSIGFRFLRKNNDFEPQVNQPTLVSSNAQPTPTLDINDEVTQKSAINMEAGIALLYNISKRTRLKGGLQLNYTSYISFADGLKHPTQSYLLLNANNGGYTMAPHLSSYANSITGEKKERLNNKTVQLSLPVGADFKLLGKDKLKWYAGATLQPSYTTGGQVYAISADTKNYVEQNDLLRKWNFSAGLETFLSYKTPGGIMINAGPQLRYQFLSTYNKQYSYTEKLYNIGVKLGLTKSF